MPENQQAQESGSRVKVSGSQNRRAPVAVVVVAAIPGVQELPQVLHPMIGALHCEIHRGERRRITKSIRRQDYCRISRDRACHEGVKLL